MKAPPRIFLSYARPDEEKVNKLYQKLSEAGFKPWMDRKDILPGENWQLKIQKAIRESDFFLACLTGNSVDKRGFLQRENRYALDIWQELLDSDIYIIPVRLEECEVPESLRGFQYVDIFEEDGWTRLVKALQVGMARRASTSEAIKGEIRKPALREPSLDLRKPTPLANRRIMVLIVVVAVLTISALMFFKLFQPRKVVSTKPSEQSTKIDTTIITTPSREIPKPKETKIMPSDKREAIERLVLVARPEADGGNFYIGKYEVTNQEYMEFVRERSYRSPKFANNPNFNQLTQPVVGVSWYDAVAYCNWLSQNDDEISYALPTEEEWKLAAYGTGQREYPWGEAPPSALLANFDNPTGKPARVASYPNGATPEGVFNMGGNVWEWCNTWTDFTQYDRVIRGGSWKSTADLMRLALRAGERPDNNHRNDVGFRVIRALR